MSVGHYINVYAIVTDKHTRSSSAHRVSIRTRFSVKRHTQTQKVYYTKLFCIMITIWLLE